MKGRRYLLGGKTVEVVVQWRCGHGPVGPKNVLVRFDDGRLVVVPFDRFRFRRIQ